MTDVAVEAPAVATVTVSVAAVAAVFVPPTPLTLQELRDAISKPLAILTADMKLPLAAIGAAAKMVSFTGFDATPVVAIVQKLCTGAQAILPVANEILANDQDMDGVLWAVNTFRYLVAKYKAPKAQAAV